MATCGTACPKEIYLLPASTARAENCISVRPDYGVKPVIVVHVHRSVLPGCSPALSSPVAREGWGALSCSPVIIATTSSLHAWWVGTPPATRPARITPDTAGEAHHLLEVVADDDNADATSQEVSDEGLDLCCLPDTERSRRLVHDNQLAAPHHTARDSDRLTLPTRESPYLSRDGRHPAGSAPPWPAGPGSAQGRIPRSARDPGKRSDRRPSRRRGRGPDTRSRYRGAALPVDRGR